MGAKQYNYEYKNSIMFWLAMFNFKRLSVLRTFQGFANGKCDKLDLGNGNYMESCSDNYAYTYTYYTYYTI